MINSNLGAFLLRRKSRQASDDLSRHIVLGLLISGFLIGFGTFKYYFVISTNDNVWHIVMLMGWVAIVITLILPTLWMIPERLLRVLGTKIGQVVFGLLLVPIYYILIWPVGVFLKFTRGTCPIYSWQNTPPKNMEGWQSVKFIDTTFGNSGKPVKRLSLLDVLGFFVRRGNLLFIPVIFILGSLGIVLFFIQTSALAPFIYTIF